MVENICVVPKSLLNCTVALVLPNQKAIYEIASRQLGKGWQDLESVCGNQDVARIIHEDLISVGLDQGLKSIELPSMILVCHEEWTPENLLLTAAMKLKRVNIAKKYARDLDRMFAFLADNPHKIRIRTKPTRRL